MLVLQMAQLWSSRYMFFLLDIFLVFSPSLRSSQKRICVFQGYQQTTSRRREVRRLLYLEDIYKLFPKMSS
jgi:hypothetical protein